MKKFIKLSFIVSIFLLLNISYARNWQVPEYFTSGIQSAISSDSVHNGDTVSVWVHYAPPDTYYENIDFLGKNIVVVNRSFISNTGYSPNPKWIVISGQDSASVVSFSSGETQSAILKGFTIQNGLGTVYGQFNYRYGGGIFCLNASPQIIMNRITANTISGLGGGIAISGESAHPTICQDTIDNNSANMFGGGIYYDGFADPDIDSNYIYDNGRNTSGGGAIYVTNDTNPNSQLGKIYANKIKGNIAYHGFAAYFYNATPILRCNEFADNYGDSSENVIECDCSFGQSALPDFGNAGDLGLNIFKDTSGRFFLVNGSSATLKAQGNYWKSLHTPDIRKRVSPSSYVAFDTIAASDRIASVSYNSACSTDVIVTGDLTVDSGISLTIAPGKTFQFATTADTNTGDYSSCELVVKGKLKAIGTSTNNIRFSSYSTFPQVGDWYGVRLMPNSTGRLKNCILNYAYCGIQASANDTLVVDSSLIELNQVYGIKMLRSKYAQIRTNKINTCTYGIYSQFTAPIINNNGFFNNTRYGILFIDTTYANITANKFTCGQMLLEPTLYGIEVGRVGDGVNIDSNKISGWKQGGIYIRDSSQAQLSKDSIISNSEYGILCRYSSTPKVRWCVINDNDAGVFCDESGNPNLGTDEEPGYNSIDTSNIYFVINKNPEEQGAIKAKYNWWGTDNPDANKFIGLVDYEPFLSKPPEDGGQSAGITSTSPIFFLSKPKPNPASKDVKIVYSLPTQCKTEYTETYNEWTG